MAKDNNKTMNKRDAFKQRLAAKYPEGNFDDEEAMFSQIGDDYDGYEKQIDEYKGREKAFADMFAADPRGSGLLLDMRDGKDPVIGLIRRFGKDDLKAALEDEAKQEELAKANKEFADNVAKEQGYVKEYKDNIDATITHLDKLEADGTYPAEVIDKAMELLLSIVHDGVRGKFSQETIDMAVKAVNHDTDVSNAGEEGVIRGRNDRYEEKLRKEGKGDGTPALAGKNGGVRKRDDGAPALGALENYGDNQKNIWERGGEKRTKM